MPSWLVEILTVENFSFYFKVHIFFSHLQERPFTMWLDCWPLPGYCVPGDERDFAVALVLFYTISQCLSHMFCQVSGMLNHYFPIKMSNKFVNYKIVYSVNFIKKLWIKKDKGHYLSSGKTLLCTDSALTQGIWEVTTFWLVFLTF